MKIPTSEVELINGKAYHNDIEINLKDKEILSNYFTYNIPDVKIIQNRIRKFSNEMTYGDFRQLVMCNCLSKLYSESKIVYDQSIVDDCNEPLKIYYYNYINDIYGIEMQGYNSHHFDKSSLTKEKTSNDSYRYYLEYNNEKHLCIDEHGKDTYFFKDIAYLTSLFTNVILVEKDSFKKSKKMAELSEITGNSIIYNLYNDDKDHQSCFDDIIEDYTKTYNEILLKELGCNNNNVLLFCKDLKNYNSFNDPYYDLVHIKSQELTNPSFLMDELLNCNNEETLKCGLNRLGFIDN